jgi:hypothetical protein
VPPSIINFYSQNNELEITEHYSIKIGFRHRQQRLYNVQCSIRFEAKLLYRFEIEHRSSFARIFGSDEISFVEHLFN